MARSKNDAKVAKLPVRTHEEIKKQVDSLIELEKAHEEAMKIAETDEKVPEKLIDMPDCGVEMKVTEPKEEKRKGEELLFSDDFQGRLSRAPEWEVTDIGDLLYEDGSLAKAAEWSDRLDMVAEMKIRMGDSDVYALVTIEMHKQ